MWALNIVAFCFDWIWFEEKNPLITESSDQKKISLTDEPSSLLVITSKS